MLPFRLLTRTVIVELRGNNTRQGKRTAALPGLRLDQAWQFIGQSLERDSNVQDTSLEVDILPAQPKRLPLAKSEGQGDRVQCLEPITAHGGEETCGPDRIEGTNIGALDAGRVGEHGDIACH